MICFFFFLLFFFFSSGKCISLSWNKRKLLSLLLTFLFLLSWWFHDNDKQKIDSRKNSNVGGWFTKKVKWRGNRDRIPRNGIGFHVLKLVDELVFWPSWFDALKWFQSIQVVEWTVQIHHAFTSDQIGLWDRYMWSISWRWRVEFSWQKKNKWRLWWWN